MTSKKGAQMSAEENEVVVRRYVEEVWNRHDIDATDGLVSSDYLNHAATAEHQRGIAEVESSPTGSPPSVMGKCKRTPRT